LWDVSGVWKRFGEYERLSPKRLEQLWINLAASDDNIDRFAMYQLIAVPDQSVPFLAKKYQPKPREEPKHLPQLIRDLDSPTFAVRERATRELESMEIIAKHALEQTLAQGAPLEVRRRIDKLLKRIDEIEAREVSRLWYAVRIVASVETAAARRLLREWANGDPNSELTRQARRWLGYIKDQFKESE
jgi:hypothetical protein